MSTSTAQEIELIAFQAGDEEFCIDVQNVREIRGWTPATPLPHAPPHVVGLINLRGIVLPVVDLKAQLGCGKTEPSSRHVIIVIHNDTTSAGLLVDSVHETLKITTDMLQQAPEVGITGDNRLVDAILPMDGRMLSKLVVERLLPREELAAA